MFSAPALLGTVYWPVVYGTASRCDPIALMHSSMIGVLRSLMTLRLLPLNMCISAH